MTPGVPVAGEGPRAGMAPLLAAGLGVGALSGLLGVGGGIVLVPILVLLIGYRQKNAQATSLAAITLTAVSGAVTYGLADDVLLAPAAIVAVGGLIGAVLGGGLLHRMSEAQVRTVFALLMVVVAVRMLWPAGGGSGDDVLGIDPLVLGGYLLAGLAMGVLSAMLGVGGGVILVPTFVLIFGLTPHEAQGTSLAVMVPVSLMGAWRNARHGYTDWRAGAWLGAGGVAGAPLGASLALVLPEIWLQRIFAALLIYTAIQLIRRARAERRERG